MDARTKAVKIHRKRLRTRGMKRVEVTVPARDAEYVRQLASVLREQGPEAKRLIAELKQIVGYTEARSAADVIDAGPDISSAAFDCAFEEINRLRRDPTVQSARKLDL